MSASADPLEVVWQALEGGGCAPRGPAHDFRARCPAHDGDNAQALHVKVGADGRALLWCFVGCEAEQIVDALGLSWPDLFPPGHHHARRPRMLAKPRYPADVVLDACRELHIDYRPARSDGFWVLDACPRCGLAEVWLHEEEQRRRIRLCCMNGCEQHAVLAALAGTEER